MSKILIILLLSFSSSRAKHEDENVNAITVAKINDSSETPYFDVNDTLMEDDVGAFNGSYEDYVNEIRDYIRPKTWTWVLVGCHTVVFVVGLVGNVLVCAAVYRNHAMRTVTNYFIVNLALADFLVILLCLPPTVIWDVMSTWFFGNAMCKVVLYFQTVSVTVSVLTLTFISIDRWYAICYPLKFKSTTRRAKTAIVFIWIVALLFDIPELLVYTASPHPKIRVDTIYFTRCGPSSWSDDTEAKWTILKMALLYGFPLAFMSATYFHIIKVLWRSGSTSHQISSNGGSQITFCMASNSSTKSQLRSRRKAAIMLVYVVAMFGICYFPVHLLSLLRLKLKMSNTDLNQAFAMISHWLCYVNSAVNPVIYNFMSSKFRKEFKRSMQCCTKSAHREVVQMDTLLGKRHHSLMATLSTKSETVKTGVD